jgi:hypothetical protein
MNALRLPHADPTSRRSIREISGAERFWEMCCAIKFQAQEKMAVTQQRAWPGTRLFSLSPRSDK